MIKQAKLSYFLRKNGDATEQTVCVRHFHKTKDTEFVRTTKVKVAPAYFDTATGKIINLPQAPEWNATIQRVATDIETASRNLIGKGVHPTKAAMTAEYDRIEKERETRKVTAPQAQRILERYIDVLRVELVELELQVEAKKKEIEAEELRMGIYDQKLLTKFIYDYATSKKETASHNTTRLYRNLASVIIAFNPAWRIDEVTPESLAAFEKWMIANGKRNLTITDAITKVKTVVYANAKKLGINTADLKDHKTDVKKKRNPNVVFLTKEELQDLIDIELTNETEKKVRDRFVLMALTGVRYSDSSIKPENIFNDELLFSTEKTDTDITIPISDQVKEILERYDNTIPTYPLQHFNKVIKRVCRRIESLQRNIIIKEYKGANKPIKSSVKKCEVITAHVARRTLINLALERGVNPVVIASIVGHEGTDLIMSTYGSKEAGKEKLTQLLD